jgi:hypothetical protein
MTEWSSKYRFLDQCSQSFSSRDKSREYLARFYTFKRDFFKKGCSCIFFPFNQSTFPQYFYFFLKLVTNTRSLAKNQKNRTTLRVSTKRPKIGYFELKKRGIKIKKVRQQCQFLIFLMKFSQFMQFLMENRVGKIRNFPKSKK